MHRLPWNLANVLALLLLHKLCHFILYNQLRGQQTDEQTESPPPPPPPSSWSEPCVASYRMEDTKNLLIRKTGKLVKNLIRITTQRTIQILWGSAQPSRPTLYQVLLVTIIISMLYIQPHVTRPWENKQETFLKSTACTHQIWITPYKAIN